MGIKTAAPWNLSTARLFLAVLKKGAGSAFQNVAQKDVRHDQAARHMERPFERAAFARRLGGLAVPAQITVPFAADVVRKTGFAVLRRFEKPFQVLFVLCIPVSHQAGDQDLVVGPPQLHVVLIRLRRQALAVDEVQQALDTQIFIQTAYLSAWKQKMTMLPPDTTIFTREFLRQPEE